MDTAQARKRVRYHCMAVGHILDMDVLPRLHDLARSANIALDLELRYASMTAFSSKASPSVLDFTAMLNDATTDLAKVRSFLADSQCELLYCVPTDSEVVYAVRLAGHILDFHTMDALRSTVSNEELLIKNVRIEYPVEIKVRERLRSTLCFQLLASSSQIENGLDIIRKTAAETGCRVLFMCVNDRERAEPYHLVGAGIVGGKVMERISTGCEMGNADICDIHLWPVNPDHEIVRFSIRGDQREVERVKLEINRIAAEGGLRVGSE